MINPGVSTAVLCFVLGAGKLKFHGPNSLWITATYKRFAVRTRQEGKWTKQGAKKSYA